MEDFRDDLEKPEAQLPRELIMDRPPPRSVVEELLNFFEAGSFSSFAPSAGGKRACLGLFETSPIAKGAEISMLVGFLVFPSTGDVDVDESRPRTRAFSANIFQSSPRLRRK